MRWLIPILTLVSLSVSGQEKVDSISSNWLPKEETFQARKAWNGLLIPAISNPSFAGFDRKLQFQDIVRADNSRLTDDNYPHFRMYNTTTWIDLAFGPKNENLGLNFRFDSGKKLETQIQKVSLALSYRVDFPKNHKLVFGIGGSYLHLRELEVFGTYPDQIDPRYGFVYSTNERLPKRDVLHTYGLSFGLNYNWKRLLVATSIRYERTAILVTETLEHHPIVKLDASYIISANEAFSLMPILSTEYNNFRFDVHPALGLAWKKLVFVTVGTSNISQFQLRLGGQFWKIWRLHFSFSTPFNQSLITDNGYSFEIGSRIQFGLKEIR